MASVFKKIKELFSSMKTNFFLRKHTLQPFTLQLLKDLYPGVDWNRVDFYEGLPWHTPVVAPYVTAQALPQFYSFSRYRIYLKKFDESRAQCLSDIVHEGFHIMQSMHFRKGYGFGFFRGFLFYYIAHFLKYGYRQNPFEIPAYDQEFRFLDFCEKQGLHGIVPKVDPDAFKTISKERSLIFAGYNFSYKENPLRLMLSFIFCVLLVILKPMADVLVFLIRPVIPKNRLALVN